MARTPFTRRFAALSAAALTAVMGLSGLQAVTAPAAQAATPQLTATSSATGGVFPGDPVTATVSATDVGSAPAYNLTFTAVLPAGVSYIAGTSTPTTLVGDPVAYPDLTNPDPATRTTTLVWANVSDLQNGASQGITFQVRPDATAYPVGSQFTLRYGAYANADPRFVPKFDPTTNAIDSTTYDASATPGDTITKIVPFQITKSEPSPNHELVRGVHPTDTTPSVYTLKVSNNGLHQSTNMTVVDYLPATIEYLGCGGTGQDNSVARNPEYNYLGPTPPAGPGPDLNQLSPLSGCVTPDSIETTNTEAPPGVTPGAVYTKITWNLGTEAANQTETLPFYMGPAIRSNTMTWDLPGGGTTTTPPTGALAQGINLDNNNGPFTTQTATPLTATNVAVLEGDYSGPTDPSVPTPHFQTAASVTDTINDLAIYKSVSPSTFSVGQLVTYTLLVRTSEYRRSHGIVIVDHLPSGMCPVDAVANYSTYTGSTTSPDPACGPVAGANPSQAYSNVSQNADGTYNITWNAPDQAAGTAYTITFKARALGAYAGTSGAAAGLPTVSGDSFTNTVNITGVTTAVVDAAQAGDLNVDVSSHSEAELATNPPTISKLVSSDVGPANMDCTANSVVWLHPTTSPDTRPTYHLGDRVCFRLRVNFPSSISTKDATVTDFLPAGLTFEAGSLTTTFAGSANDLPAGQINATTSATGLSVGLGTTSYGNGHTYVDPGKTYDAVFSAIVTNDTALGTLYDVPGNLMKFRYSNTAGAAYGLRDGVDLKIGATPRVDLADSKSITAINGNPRPAGTKEATVRAGDVVDFALGLVNNGVQAAGDVVMWDVLPPGFTCADVSAISAPGTCTDNATSTEGTRATLKWTLAGPNQIPGLGSHAPLTYKVTVPSWVGIDQVYENHASLRSYTTQTNTGTTNQWYPADNIDPAVTPGMWNAQPATDSAELYTYAATMTKVNTTDLTEAGNATVGQATVGEGVTWTVTTTLPHGTTIFNGVITDTLPAGVALNGTPTVLVNGAADPNFVVSTPTAGTVNVTLPATYQVPSGSPDAVVVLTVPVTVSDIANTVSRGKVLTNRATLVSGADPNLADEGSDPDVVTASNGVTVVEPNLSLSKTDNTTNKIVVPGQGVLYTLTLKNNSGSNVSTAHNVVITDVVPAGMTISGPITPSPFSVTTDVSGVTTIVWNVGDLAPGASKVFTYTADVELTAASGETYKNVVTGTSSSLPSGGRTTGSNYNPSANDTVTVLSPAVTKSVTPGKATIGDVVTYTVKATIPPSVNVPNATLLDTAPAGLTNITPVSATCDQFGSPCAEFDGSALTINPATPLVHGWYLGDFTGAGSIVSGTAYPRVVTLTYTAQIANVPANIAGKTLTNSARIYWNKVTTGSPVTSVPANPNVVFDFAGVPATATVTVTEPNVTIAKSVDKTNLGPTDVATYTLKVSNASGANVSPAYDMSISDKVPTGLVVDTSSISGGGMLDPLTNTITWTVPGALAPSASTTLTYKASLAASGTLSANQALKNTAAVASYTGVSGGVSCGGRVYVGNTDSATVTAVFPKVTISKTLVTPATPKVDIGQATVWSLVVTNTGAAPANGLSVADVLPPSWAYSTGTATVQGPSGSPVSAEPAVTPNTNGDTLTWAGLPTLAPGQTATIVYTAVPGAGVVTNPGVGPLVSHTNTATVATATDLSGATGTLDGAYAGASATGTVTVISADLAIAKSHTGTLVPGTNVTWNLAVTNNGPDAATGPQTVTDVLPTGLTYVSSSGTGWSCAATGQTVTCTHAGSLAANATSTVNLVTAVAPDVTGLVSNTATVTDPSYDPDLSNNTSTDTGLYVPTNDIAITKKLNGTLLAGSTAAWALHVTNNGPSTSTSKLTVTDTLPASVSNAAASGTGWTCSVTPATGSGQLVSCDWTGTLAPGSAVPNDIAITGTLASGTTGTVSNTASVTGGLNDPDLTNNTSTATGTVGTSADLSIVKSHEGALIPGAPFNYTLAVHNAGPSDAVNPQVTDVLPAALTFVSATGTGWSCSAVGQTVTCDLAAPLAAGADAAPITLTVTTLPSQNSTIVNTATVSSTTTDPDLTNNSSTDVILSIVGITPHADLSLTKTHVGDAVAGQSISYDLVATNNGPSNDPGPIVITDTLPAGMTFASNTDGVWSCGAVGQVVTCTYNSHLAAGASAPTLTIVADVDAAVPAGTLTNQAIVSGGAVDTNPDNNTASDPTTIVVSTDLAIVKKASSPTFNSGLTSAGSFTLQVSNLGPSVAADTITVTDTLPVGLSFLTATGTGWDCGSMGQVVTCTTDTDVAPGTDAPTITVTVGTDRGLGDPTPVTLTNTAVVSTTPGQDPNPDNDSSSAWVQVAASADLSITKTHPVDPVSAGQQIPFAINVHNAGPSPALEPITVTDTLPAGMSYVSASAPWSCTPNGQVATCTLTSDIGVNADAPTLTLTALVSAAAPAGSLTNQAAVSAGTPDPNTANNTATDPVSLVTNADLAIVKTHTGTATVGQNLTYTLTVTNNGPSDAVNAAVSDAMPTTLTPVSADATGWNCTVAGQNVACTTPTLAAGATAAITVVARVNDSAVQSGITNTANVTSETTDPDTSNNSSTDTISSGDIATYDLKMSKTIDSWNDQTSTAIYRLVVSNVGKATHTGNIVVVDNMPAQLTYVSSTGSGWHVTVSGQRVTAVTTQTLVAGAATTPLLITTKVSAQPGESITNSAYVKGGGGDGNNNNNDGHATLPGGKLPHTGATNELSLLSLGLLLIAFGAVLLLRRRQA